MELPKINFAKFDYPLKLLLIGNADTWGAFLAVIEDLTPEQLAYKHPGLKLRSIAEMTNHALDCQYGFFTQKLALGKPGFELYREAPKTVKEVQQRVIETYAKTVKLWQGFGAKDFTREIKTPWGQVLTGELALFQSITHTHYHVSEICFLRGLGGFATVVMG